jgi:hypothetical protein
LASFPSLDFPTICPFCNQRHDAATMVRGGDVDLDNGDVTLCFGCGRFCVFDSDAYGGLRKPTKKEQRRFDRDPELKEVVTAWRIVKRG